MGADKRREGVGRERDKEKEEMFTLPRRVAESEWQDA